MEDHLVIGHDAAVFNRHAVSAHRIAAAHELRRKHGLDSRVPEQAEAGKADFREQAVIAAAREVEDRFCVLTRCLRIADHRNRGGVGDVQHVAKRVMGTGLRQFPVDEHEELALLGREAGGRRRILHGVRRRGECRVRGETFRHKAEIHEHGAGELDGGRVLQLEELHASLLRKVAAMVALSREEVPDLDCHVTEIDLHRAGRQAAHADCAVIAEVRELIHMTL